jgi:hypothetical protein
MTPVQAILDYVKIHNIHSVNQDNDEEKALSREGKIKP